MAPSADHAAVDIVGVDLVDLIMDARLVERRRTAELLDESGPVAELVERVVLFLARRAADRLVPTDCLPWKKYEPFYGLAGSTSCGGVP